MAKTKKPPKNTLLTQVERGDRGLVRFEGADSNGCNFSLQESSSASTELLWLGPEQMLNRECEAVGFEKARLHLSPTDQTDVHAEKLEQLAKVKARLLEARLPAKAGVGNGVANLTVAQVDLLLDLVTEALP